jgi:DNA-binding MarR family transcriptional regulator
VYDIADKIIDLRLNTRRVCMCEGEKNKKSTITLKTKVLFLIEQGNGTKDIILSLGIAKTNLALLTSSLSDEGLIVKKQKIDDKREKSYALTEKGKQHLDNVREKINLAFKTVITTDEEFDEAEQKIDAVLDLMSFIGY